ncbi:uncharacterized protein LOC129734173 [Falco cherrug]|uniref:uncharacterized protein LOC129734173 n=1 Tax=Falco cherrug TaxID=345164 RepID=UPI002479D499|nr:uncharacterized protein LOC129734173 [Falco cherrug]
MPSHLHPPAIPMPSHLHPPAIPMPSHLHHSPPMPSHLHPPAIPAPCHPISIPLPSPCHPISITAPPMPSHLHPPAIPIPSPPPYHPSPIPAPSPCLCPPYAHAMPKPTPSPALCHPTPVPLLTPCPVIPFPIPPQAHAMPTVTLCQAPPPSLLPCLCHLHALTTFLLMPAPPHARAVPPAPHRLHAHAVPMPTSSSCPPHLCACTISMPTPPLHPHFPHPAPRLWRIKECRVLRRAALGAVPALGMGGHERTQTVQGYGSAGAVAAAGRCPQHPRRDATPYGILQGHLCHECTRPLPPGVTPPAVVTGERSSLHEYPTPTQLEKVGDGLWHPPGCQPWVPTSLGTPRPQITHVPKSLLSPHPQCPCPTKVPSSWCPCSLHAHVSLMSSPPAIPDVLTSPRTPLKPLYMQDPHHCCSFLPATASGCFPDQTSLPH